MSKDFRNYDQHNLIVHRKNKWLDFAEALLLKCAESNFLSKSVRRNEAKFIFFRPVHKNDFHIFHIFKLNHSVLKLFTGLAIAAFIAWKLIVANAIKTARNPAAINIHQLMFMR